MAAAVAASAGAGATIAVRHGLPVGQAAVRLPDDAAAGWPGLLHGHQGFVGAEGAGAMNDQTVYDEVAPGVVDISSKLRYLQETAEGTGIVIDAASGLVLTNNHVIDGAASVTVTPALSGTRYRAAVLGYDQADDVALLRLRGATGLRAVVIGRSSRVTVGTPVLAIGNEAGQGGPPTVAPGIITGLHRTIEATDDAAGVIETLHGMLETSAGIRPGDSGGPLANAAGQVIGIDTAAGGTAGYAIPIDKALSIACRIAARQASGAVRTGLSAFPGGSCPAAPARTRYGRLTLNADPAG